MRQRIAIKNHNQEIRLTMRRSVFIFCMMLLLLVVLAGRLAYLQIYQHEVYSTLSTKNRVDLLPVEPTRGLIYDRNGKLLVDNIPVYSLDLIPIKVDNIDQTISELQKLIAISDDSVAQFKKQMRQHRRFDEIPLKLKLTEKEVAKFAVNRHRFPGVMIKARLMRRYLFGETFSHVLGYVGRINAKELREIDQVNYSASHYIGKIGIEKYYEDQLHGKVGYEEVETDASGRTIRTLSDIKATPGSNLYLTLDTGLQEQAKKALKGHRGAIVAIQPSTGQILAMVSEPGYDPNLFVQGMSHETYQALQTSKNLPLFDRTLRGLYPPASTVKPFYALQGLDTGAITKNTLVYDPGWYQVSENSHRFHDWLRSGHGNMSVRGAIMVSCDTFFYDLANRLGISKMNDIMDKFGFGKPSGVDLYSELGGVNPNPEWKREKKGTGWYEGDTILTGIGQGMSQTTPLQLASAVATMANRGVRYQPHLLMGAQVPGQDYIANAPGPVETITLNDDKNWDIVINAMQKVITSRYGTGFRFGRQHPYTVAAKTGTAQLVSKSSRRDDETDSQSELPEHLRDHHLFIAFAPVDHPAIAVAVITENYNYASTIARSIFDYYFGVKPDADKPSETDSQ